jgi:hypothetical protein
METTSQFCEQNNNEAKSQHTESYCPAQESA